MSLERQPFSAMETQGLLSQPESAPVIATREWLVARGITGVFMDLDDTLVATRCLFDKKMLAAALCLAGLGYDQEAVVEEIIQAIKLYRDVVQVNPILMPQSVLLAVKNLSPQGQLRLSLKNQLGSGLKEALDVVRSIYTTCPDVFPGACELVDLFGQAGFPPTIVTHCRQEWADQKVDEVGLADKVGRVVGLDVNLPKPPQWAVKFQELGSDPTKVLGIGDSPKADIKPLLDLGAYAIWVNWKNEDVPKDLNPYQKAGRLFVVDNIDKVAGLFEAS